MTAGSLRTGGVAALAMASFYAVVVAAASGSVDHLVDQVRQDWPYLALIITGFGVQVALLAELRHRRALHHGEAMAGGAGAGASTIGMIACCAHHLADLLPLVGAVGIAGFLTDQRIPVMLLGIAINAVGVFVTARHLHRLPAVVVDREEPACVAA